jgi:Nif-specific regulatory protein
MADSVRHLMAVGPTPSGLGLAGEGFYRALVDLERESDLATILSRTLAIAVEATGAERGYLELHADDDPADGPRHWAVQGVDGAGLEAVRARISRGIVAMAMASGEPVSTSSALLDPRFKANVSVLAERIEAVLCVPVGIVQTCGVLYLEGRSDTGPFEEADRVRAEIAARHLALVVGQQVDLARPAAPPVRSRAGVALRLDGIIGSAPAFVDVLRQISLAAPHDMPVLLTGPTGSGKSQLARVLHDSGPRARQPFVEVNCASLPEGLIESELFGAMPGAWTGLTRRIEGRIAAAEHGTLFLDEIVEFPPHVQAKILQLTQSREYYPLGSNRPIRADVRIVTACNADLQRAIADGRFREDLYFRLAGIEIDVPHLSQRREDIPQLVRHFCAQAVARGRLSRVEPSPAALCAAQAAEWPGNVRQLERAVEMATLRAHEEGSEQLQRHHLFPPKPRKPGDPEVEPRTYQEALMRFKASFILRALEDENWDANAVARRIDVARSHVYNLIKGLELERQRRR